MLCALSLTSCTKEADVKVVTITTGPSGPVCDHEILGEPFIPQLPLSGSGDRKLVLLNSRGLKTMAYTGSVNQLRAELECLEYETDRVNILRNGHVSDINRIGFASQLLIENEWLVAMYHPNNFPDHFIIYNVITEEWFRYDHSDQDIYLQG